MFDVSDFGAFKQRAEECLPDELAAWTREQRDAASALDACPYADWLLRLAECFEVARAWQLKATATCVRALLVSTPKELTDAVDAVEAGASFGELKGWLARVDVIGRTKNMKPAEAARAVQDLLHVAMVPDDEGMTAAIAHFTAESLARDELLPSGAAAFLAAFDRHRRALRGQLGTPHLGEGA